MKGPAATTVDEYLAAVPSKAREALEKLRRAIQQAAPEAEECISYRIPLYKLQGDLVAFSAAKNHYGFYVMSPGVIKAHRKELEGYSTSTGTVRLPADRPIPVPLVKKLVKARIAENARRAAAK